MADRDEFGAFMIGFVVGALTGAVVSLLFAPQSGEETRVLIKERAIELGDKASETAQTVSKDVGTMASEYRTKAEELAGKARTQAEELAKKGQAVIEEQRTKVTEAVQSMTKPKDETPV
jgi:gas vesicle protein